MSNTKYPTINEGTNADKILHCLAEHPEPITAEQVLSETGLENYESVRTDLNHLEKPNGWVKKVGKIKNKGTYVITEKGLDYVSKKQVVLKQLEEMFDILDMVRTKSALAIESYKREFEKRGQHDKAVDKFIETLQEIKDK